VVIVGLISIQVADPRPEMASRNLPICANRMPAADTIRGKPSPSLPVYQSLVAGGVGPGGKMISQHYYYIV